MKNRLGWFAPAFAGVIILTLAYGPAAPRTLGAPVNPPIPAPSGPVNPPGVETPPGGAPPTSAPLGSPAPLPSGAPTPPAPAGSAPAAPLGPAPSDTFVPGPGATQPPIIVEPPAPGVAIGFNQTLRVMSALGPIAATIANPALADVFINQETRTITLFGRTAGDTTLTVSDSRGMTREIPVHVAYNAGSIADAAELRITGNPATSLFVKEQALAVASRLASLRPGARVNSNTDTINFSRPLGIDDIALVDVPIILQGEGYFTVAGTTHVRVTNFAQPRIRPRSLMVSDFPETLKENGVLFTADLRREEPSRFLYYHYNPAGQPDRRIVLRVQNTSPQPALVQFISGQAGPGAYEMEVGHLSTQRFLVHEAQNEGLVVSVPGNATISLVDQGMPAKSVVQNILQLRELEGVPLHLTLVAVSANDTLEGVLPASLLSSDVKHARGIYPIPEFYFDYTWNVDDNPLEASIGQIPLPNLREGEALGGDYGVLQSITFTIHNPNDSPASIALYQNPRGGGATGTYLIDRVLIQSHATPAFSKYKLRQYTVPAHGYIRTSVVTMPEGGSSYPVRLIVARDDGSVAPGGPGSPIY